MKFLLTQLHAGWHGEVIDLYRFWWTGNWIENNGQSDNISDVMSIVGELNPAPVTVAL